jgi:transcriptional regulator with XRE-family HTH domain
MSWEVNFRDISGLKTLIASDMVVDMEGPTRVAFHSASAQISSRSMSTDSAGFYKDVGHRVRTARESRGLTQDALAGRLSLKRTSVTNIECGRQQLLAHTLMRLAEVLGVAVESLLPARGNVADALAEEIKRRPEDEQRWIRAVVAAGGEGRRR